MVPVGAAAGAAEAHGCCAASSPTSILLDHHLRDGDGASRCAGG